MDISLGKSHELFQKLILKIYILSKIKKKIESIEYDILILLFLKLITFCLVKIYKIISLNVNV